VAIKAGQILHDINGFVIDRIQTGGPGALNIPEEKIYELGNKNSVATVRDIPDLSFDLESLDVSTEFESVLLAQTPIAAASIGTTGDEFDFNNSVPIDVISPFKSSNAAYDIVRGLVVPCLSLERVTYRFGVRQNAVQQFMLKGDSIYYTPGVPHWEEVNYAGGVNDDYDFTFPGAGGSPTPIDFVEQGNTYQALSVTLVNTATGGYKRLFFDDVAGSGYENQAGGFRITADYGSGTGEGQYNKVRFTYASDGGTGVSYTQDGNSPTANNALHKVHQGTSVKPAAVRGKDIKVYVSDDVNTGTWTLFRGVQTVEMTRSVNLENDEELGNHHYVTQDYVTPDVTGSFSVKPIDTADLWAQIAQITGVDASQVIGPQTTTTVGVKAEILDPEDGNILKTIHVPDARFQVPGLSGRANQKLETTFNFTSDGGRISVYDGEM
jgi:hypothetical protein